MPTSRANRARKKNRAKKSVSRGRPRRSASSVDAIVRAHLRALLKGGDAHATVDQAVADMPVDRRHVAPSGAPFTPWQVLEHARIAQWDILEFSRDAAHVSPEWPAGYWPAAKPTPPAGAWDETVRALRADLAALERLVSDPATDLYASIPHGTGQTVLREALVAATHTSYHLGQLVLLRKLLGAWPS